MTLRAAVTARTVNVTGYREFVRACNRAGLETRQYVRATFKEVGEIVRRDAAQRFSAVDARSAAGFRVAVRVRGVAVEQRRGKTTGQHPEYGALQMRKALLPAAHDNEDNVIREFEHAIDVVADHFDNK